MRIASSSRPASLSPPRRPRPKRREYPEEFAALGSEAILFVELGGYRLAGTGGPPVDRRTAVVPFGEGLTHVVAERRVSLLVENQQAHPRAIAAHWSAERGMPVYLGVPIEAAGELLGVLNVNFSTAAPPSADEREFIEALAGQAAVALRNVRLFAELDERRASAAKLAADNARLYAESLQRRRQAEELARVARALTETLEVSEIAAQISDSVHALFDVRSGLLAIAQPDGALEVLASFGPAANHYPPGTRFAPGEGTPGRAFASGLPAWSDDVQGEPPELRAEDLRRRNHTADIRAALAVPLVAKGRRIGVLSVGDQIPRRFADGEVATLQAFADQLALALDNARLYGEAERRREEAEELARVARALTGSLDTEAVAHRIVESVLPLFRAQSASFRLRQPDGSLVVAACTGPLAAQLPRGDSIRPGVGVAGRVGLEGRALWTSDLLADPRVTPDTRIRDRIAAIGGVSALGVPLRVNQHLIGVLTITDVRGRLFAESEISLLQAFADQAAVAIDNARLYASQKRRAEEKEILLGIARDVSSALDVVPLLTTITQRAAQAVGMERRSIFLWREGRLEPVMSQFADGRPVPELSREFRKRLGSDVGTMPAFTEMFQAATPLVVEDATTSTVIPRWWIETLELKSVLVVPLVHQNAVVGVLYFDNTGQAVAISHDQIVLAATIASQVALAIEHAELYRELHHRLGATESLLAVARSLAQTLDTREVARRAVRELTRLLGADTSVFFGQPGPDGAAPAIAGYRVPTVLRDRRYRVAMADVPPSILEAARTGQPLATSDPSSDPRFDHPMIRGIAVEPRSLIFTPVIAGGQSRGGIMTFWWAQRRDFSRDDFALAEGLASQLGLALENAEVHQSTHHALADLQQLQDEALRRATLQALGNFAIGAAHHLNNRLTVASGRLQLAMMKRVSPAVASDLVIARRAVDDGADIIRALQRFGGGRRLEPLEPVNLNDVVATATAVTEPPGRDASNDPRAAIELALDRDLPSVGGVAEYLRDAVASLLRNAVEATPSGGSITIRTWADEGWACCSVTDTGIGMSPEIQRRAIEPFFTTKGVHRRGLGLSVAHGIVRRHGGELTVESEAGRGTTVTFRLPATRQR